MSEPLSDTQQLANRYHLAARDMQDALRFLDACQELQTIQEQRGDSLYFDHCEGLLSAAIVAYCRPFLKSFSLPFATKSLKPEHLQAVVANAELHNLLLYKRDKFVAHADWSERKTELLSVDPGGIVLRKFPLPSLSKGLDINAFTALAKDVSTEAQQRAYDLDLNGHAPQVPDSTI